MHPPTSSYPFTVRVFFVKIQIMIEIQKMQKTPAIAGVFFEKEQQS
jgi:hypothetical protein